MVTSPSRLPHKQHLLSETQPASLVIPNCLRSFRVLGGFYRNWHMESFFFSLSLSLEAEVFAHACFCFWTVFWETKYFCLISDYKCDSINFYAGNQNAVIYGHTWSCGLQYAVPQCGPLPHYLPKMSTGNAVSVLICGICTVHCVLTDTSAVYSSPVRIPDIELRHAAPKLHSDPSSTIQLVRYKVRGRDSNRVQWTP